MRVNHNKARFGWQGYGCRFEGAEVGIDQPRGNAKDAGKFWKKNALDQIVQ